LVGSAQKDPETHEGRKGLLDSIQVGKRPLRTVNGIRETTMRTIHGKWFAVLAVLMLIAVACSRNPPDEDSGPTEEVVTSTSAAPGTTTPSATPAASTTTTVSEPIELVIWADEVRAAVLAEVAAAFEEATGVGVVIEIIDFREIRGRALDAGLESMGPDIFIGAHDWTGELVASGVIQPIDLRGAASDFFQVALDGFSFEGSLYALPYATETVAMYFNTDLVPEAPATFEEIADVCAGLSGIENCVGIPGGGDVGDAYHNYPFMSALGGYIFAYDPTTGYDVGDIGLNSDGAVAGLDFLAGQIDAGVIGSISYDNAKNLFLEGQEPFWVTGPWELGTLGDSSLNWSVAKLPTIEGQAPAPFVGAQGFFVGAFSEYPVIAQSFLSDFVATAETIAALHDADPRIPAFTPVFDGLADDPVTRAFALSAADGRPIPNIPEMGAVWGPLGDNLLAIRNGELTPQEAMDAAQQAVEEALAG